MHSLSPKMHCTFWMQTDRSTVRTKQPTNSHPTNWSYTKLHTFRRRRQVWKPENKKRQKITEILCASLRISTSDESRLRNTENGRILPDRFDSSKFTDEFDVTANINASPTKFSFPKISTQKLTKSCCYVIAMCVVAVLCYCAELTIYISTRCIQRVARFFPTFCSSVITVTIFSGYFSSFCLLIVYFCCRLPSFGIILPCL